jgi:hypothetical protein
MASIVREPYILSLDTLGFIQGSTLKDNDTDKPLCRYFGGIPYAEPPVGENRWRKPRELPPCYKYGTRTDPGKFDGLATACPQRGKPKKGVLVGEDCLQVVVWVPVEEPPEEGQYSMRNGSLELTIEQGGQYSFIYVRFAIESRQESY